MTASVTFEIEGKGRVAVPADTLVFAGFASRDPADAEHHRQEIKAKGAVVPDTIPVCYVGVPATLSQAATIETKGKPLMGEVEFVVIDTPTGLYVAPGVDLFDEHLELTDIEGSKNLSATPIGARALKLADVRKDWDSFKLWMRCDGRLVQEGSVGKMMEPEKLVALAAPARTASTKVLAVYSGSMPYLEPPKAGFQDVEIGLEGPGHKLTHRFRLVR